MSRLLGKKVRELWPGAPAVFCPGCKHPHHFPTDDSNVVNGAVHKWEFNGNGDAPTFRPSMNINPSSPAHRCHSFVTDGRIQFLSDCFHELKGQTLDLPDFPAGWYDDADQ